LIDSVVTRLDLASFLFGISAGVLLMIFWNVYLTWITKRHFRNLRHDRK
jgi:hypothetical protein